MRNILVNAYAVNPNWGSEQGMGWNWVVNLAKYCHLDVITEGQWQLEIEERVAALPQRDSLKFHYLPVADEIRAMCWNQGDWRFYLHYEKWQRRALSKAKEICASKKIDILHQLNMIGFREPGYLWEIKDIPFVWGPIGGMELMPMSYLRGAPLRQRFFNRVKNVINKYQYSHSGRVRQAVEQASVLISAVKGVKEVLSKRYNKESVLISETGAEINPSIKKTQSNPNAPLKLIWVGKFDFRKQLPLAIRSVIATNNPNIELHICGTGNEYAIREMQSIVQAANVGKQIHWHGNIPHDRITEMMSQSDMLFFTSIMEATSTVVLEAISVGLPVLCFNTCGFAPIVKEFGGITVDISNPNQSISDFAHQIQKVYDNRNIINQISDRILEKRESLSWDSKARMTVELYEKCLSD